MLNARTAITAYLFGADGELKNHEHDEKEVT